ncbi:MAG: hypothetical protein PHC50_08550 [Candidatus Cloacimonetes bacterium]|nr:hypothetical protein [Candidatus Cloacimonadota bacterium]
MKTLRDNVSAILNSLANSIEENAIKIIDKGKIVAWGKLRRSIKTKVYKDDLSIDVFADGDIAPYAQYVHEGRKAGKMPPVSMIEEWARKKQLLSNSSSGIKLPVRLNSKTKLNSKQQLLAERYHSLAWAISMKMKKREIKPRRFLIEAITTSLKEYT